MQMQVTETWGHITLLQPKISRGAINFTAETNNYMMEEYQTNLLWRYGVNWNKNHTCSSPYNACVQ